MTEERWLTCTDLDLMIRHVWNRMSERKARLISCACCRRLWHLLDGEWQSGRVVIAVVERFVDGLATEAELAATELVYRAAHNQSHHRLGVRDPLEPLRYLFPDGRGFYYISSVAKSARIVLLKTERGAEFSAQADIFREIIGNPFRPVAVNGAWLAWNTGTAPKLAQSIYEERAFEHLPILADALEEAGCTDSDILDHCRGPGPHVRGCWVVDLILGQE